MIDVKYSQYIYLVPPEKGEISLQICVQRTYQGYRPALINIAGKMHSWYNKHIFDTIEDCQAYIDREALNNNWKRALITERVLY